MSYQEIKNKIDLIKEQIVHHGKLEDGQLKKINYKFRLEWNYNSNSMEGNTLTVAETRSVMVGNIDVHQKPYKDIAEMKGHDEVVSDILKIGKGELRLSEKRIKHIHESIISESVDIPKSQIGKWKERANEIINNNGEKYDFVAPELVPERMHKLLDKTNAQLDHFFCNKRNAPHPLDIAFEFHLEFLDIHPFIDGNGRMARILSNLILIATGYPPFWITNRTAYYNYISDIQSYGGKPELFYEYMAGLVLHSQQLILDVIQGRDIEEQDDIYKEIAIWKKQFEKDKSLISFSDNLVAELYSKSFRKLFLEVLERLKEFDDLFDNKEIINYITANRSFSHKADGVEYFDEAFENLVSKRHFSRSDILPDTAYIERNIKVLILDVGYYGFKNDGLNTFTVSSIIEIHFDKYKYEIYLGRKSQGDTLFTKLYSDELTTIEVKSIVRNVVLRLFEDIKSSIKN